MWIIEVSAKTLTQISEYIQNACIVSYNKLFATNYLTWQNNKSICYKLLKPKSGLY